MNMKKFVCLLFLTVKLAAHSDASRLALYQSLDPLSISEHIAFYELYKDFPEGKAALNDAWRLITKNNSELAQNLPELSFPTNIDSFIELIQSNPKNKIDSFQINDEALELIEKLGSSLSNRKLKGHKIESEAELLKLQSHEIDLAHALFLLQFSSSEDGIKKRRTYEAALDLMGLQVLARLKESSTNIDKIRALNQFIFFEMGFRFPPHSEHEQEIDRYTFLPSVLESRRGVCLGVSIVYLALAQRLNLPLEIVTPPGHIFLRYKEGKGKDLCEINIETTARGVNIPSDEYLGINEKRLKTPQLKEVVGMVYMNAASLCLQDGKWQNAIELYENALTYMPSNNTLKELLGCSYYFLEDKRAFKLFEEVSKNKDPDEISNASLSDEILLKKVTKEALSTVFMKQDKTRQSITDKKEALLKACKSCPEFLAGKFLLAQCYLQLQRPKEAIEVLEAISKKDPTDITCEYYLAVLYLGRYNDKLALKHLKQAVDIAKKAKFEPKELQDLKLKLSCRGNIVSDK